MILEAKDLALSFGADEVLKAVSFQINENERVGVVGYNGCGKTTLLSILTGELPATSGSFSTKTNLTIGYLRQTAGLLANNTVYDEMKSVNNADALLARMKVLEATMGSDAALVDEYERISGKYEAIDGYNLEFNIKRVLNGMAFPPESYSKRVSVLSGGEKTRLALAKLLIMHPDLLILDEPTNHLDLETLEWLEKFLVEYKGAILLVSHDRHFLDSVCNRILEINVGKSRVYNGNYSAFLVQKEANDLREQREYRRVNEEADKLRDYVAKNLVRASTSNMAKSRRKMLEKLDLSAPESERHESVRFTIEPCGEPHKEVLVTKELCIDAGGKTLINDLTLTLFRGEKLIVAGANGTGKTTFIKTICGKHAPKSGRIRLGGGVKLGSVEQNLYTVKSKNPLEYIRDLYPAMTQLEIRSLLASVGFRDEEVFTASSGLSGGELSRLNMARVSLEHPNLLVLDEPTNHLDIYTKDVMCRALREYAGTMIVVTHDRYLMEQLDGRVLLLEQGSYKLFESYSAFTAYRNGEQLSIHEEQKPKKSADEELERTKNEIANQKELRRKRALERERRSFVENRIEELEGEIYDLNAQLELPEVATDHEKLAEVCDKLERFKAELNELSDEWLECYADD